MENASLTDRHFHV